MVEEGRQGDWECSGCRNRNYAFRSFCNRCKQPRLLVDTKTPADSKWLPRIGDWICTGCTNNNYASREKCKKCRQLKELAALPAIAMPGASLPTYQHYFARENGGLEQKMNVGLIGNGVLQQSLPLTSKWSVGGADKYGVVQSASTWSLDGNLSSGLPYASNASQPLMVPKGWRNGVWICNCGFHNYSSRAECKKCNTSMPPVLGMKRLASEELTQEWDNKRLNAGHVNNQFLAYRQHQPYLGLEHMIGSGGDHKTGLYAAYSSASSGAIQNWQLPHQATTPTPVGKGAKQWRDGDWTCTNCNNHNYASRSNCNRCKTLREALLLPVSVV